MIVPVMAISNLVLTQQIYSEETNGAHAHYREPVPLIDSFIVLFSNRLKLWSWMQKQQTQNSFPGPKRCRGFRETGPRTKKIQN